MSKPHQSIKPQSNCYSAGEAGFMLWGQRVRAVVLGPLLWVLRKLGVSPDIITFLSLACGLVAAVLLAFDVYVALGLLVLHVLLDGLDGPLAREMGAVSSRGSFVDTMADQVVICAVTLACMQMGLLSPMAAVLYLLSYTVVVGFAMVRNALNVPYSWLVRPRFVLYGWLVVELFYWPGTLEYVTWGLTALLGLKVLSGFMKLEKTL